MQSLIVSSGTGDNRCNVFAIELPNKTLVVMNVSREDQIWTTSGGRDRLLDEALKNLTARVMPICGEDRMV